MPADLDMYRYYRITVKEHIKSAGIFRFYKINSCLDLLIHCYIRISVTFLEPIVSKI